MGGSDPATRMARFMDEQHDGHTLALLYGRRRIGKSTLLSRLTRERGGCYWEATQADSSALLAQLGAALGEHLGVGRIAFESWDEALAQLLRQGDRGPTPVVLDEFGYLIEAEPSLPSLIASRLGPHRNTGGSQARLVLCGSAIAIMQELTGGQAPLRGRASVEELMHPADFREALQWYPVGIDDHTAALVYSVVGGVVGYATDMVGHDLPDEPGDFDRWVVDRVCSPAAALHREATTLLAEDPDLSAKMSVFHSVLGQIATGSVTAGTIANGLDRSVESLSPALKRLVEAGFVRRHEDPIRQNRPTYTLDDPFLQFHYAVLAAHGHRLRDRPPIEVWRTDLRARFDSQVRGPVFEEMARTWTRRYASDDTLGGVPTVIGPSYANIANSNRELDMVAAADPQPGSKPNERTVLAIGEAKAGEQLTATHLDRLERARSGLGERARSATLLLFGASFDPKLVELSSRRHDLELVDLDRLYRGH